MAHVTLLDIPASAWIGDTDAQLEAGDLLAPLTNFLGRPAVSFDWGADEEAATSPEFRMPGNYAGGTLMATISFSIDNNADDIALDVFVEAKTEDADTLDMLTADGWDAANSGTVSLGGSTAKDPLSMDITLTNKDSVAAGDLVRFGLRRDTDSGDDDAAAILYVWHIEIWEST